MLKVFHPSVVKSLIVARTTGVVVTGVVVARCVWVSSLVVLLLAVDWLGVLCSWFEGLGSLGLIRNGVVP